MTFRFLSVCSGLEGASLAFEPLGASAVGFAEIEAFPSAIISHHYGSNMPGEELSHNAPPNFGDFTTIDVNTLGQVDLLVGGTPCQAFSVAGKRLSLADARGNLTLAYAVLAHELARSNGLRNCLWENVPGVLSAQDNAFGCFLGQIVGADDALHTPDGGSWPDAGMVAGPRARAAWRVLDAQYFGLAQRRRRVFLVADFGNGADPAAVLFEPKGLRGNNPPSRETREEIAPTIKAAAGIGCDELREDVAGCVTTREGQCYDAETTTLIALDKTPAMTTRTGTGTGTGRDGMDDFIVAHALRAEGFDAGEDGTGRGTPIVPIMTHEVVGSLNHVGGRAVPGNCAQDWDAGMLIPCAYDLRGREGGSQFEGPHDTANIRAASGGSSRSYVAFAQNTRDDVRLQGGDGEIVGALAAEPGMKQQTYVAHVAPTMKCEGDAHSWFKDDEALVSTQWAVRRLTPAECEKLQGVPVGYTQIPWRGKPAEQCPDGPRYKALGNSWAVPVVAWIGKRIIENTP